MDAGVASWAKGGFEYGNWILSIEGVEGAQRWNKDQWRGAETWGA